MTITSVLLSLLFVLFLAAALGAQNVIVLPKIGAVAEKIEEVAVDLGSAQFHMVPRLVIHDTVHNSGHFCLTNNLACHCFKTETNQLVPTWIDETSQSKITLSRHREKRSPILAAVGIAIKASALINLFSGSMTSKEIAVKSKQAVLYNHMQTVDDEVTNNHNDIVKIATSVGNLYEYSNKSFRNLSEKLKNFECHVEAERLEISYAMQKDRIMNKLYVDLVGSIVSIFNHHPTPLLLPTRTIKELIKQNKKFFENTIYLEHEYLIYHYVFICPVVNAS